VSRIYVVLRRTWHGRYSGFDDTDSLSGTPVAGFARRSEAEQVCRRLEAEARDEVASPFRLAEDLYSLSSVEEEAFCQRLMALGLTAPVGTAFHGYLVRDWAAWYDGVAATLTAEQREGIWAMLDLVQCYRVAEVELDDFS
jgi:hypothetical protein